MKQILILGGTKYVGKEITTFGITQLKKIKNEQIKCFYRFFKRGVRKKR